MRSLRWFALGCLRAAIVFLAIQLAVVVGWGLPAFILTVLAGGLQALQEERTNGL